MSDTTDSLRAVLADMLDKARLMDEDEIGGPTANRIREWADGLATALARLKAAERVVRAYRKCIPAAGRELDDARAELDAALAAFEALAREEKA